MESPIPRDNTDFMLPPIMFTSSPSTSRTTSSTLSGGFMERKWPANRQAWRRSHSSSTAPLQTPDRWTVAVRRSSLGNQGVPPSVASRFSMVSNTDSTICDNWLGSNSMLSSVGISVLSAGNVDDRVSHGLSFKPLVHLERRLGAAQQQPAASKQRAVEFFQNLFLGFGVEIDHDVAAEHQVERPQRAHALAQIDGLKTSHPAHCLA